MARVCLPSGAACAALVSDAADIAALGDNPTPKLVLQPQALHYTATTQYCYLCIDTRRYCHWYS